MADMQVKLTFYSQYILYIVLMQSNDCSVESNLMYKFTDYVYH